MGLTDNQKRLIQAVSQNDIQAAKKCARACVTEDTTQKNSAWRKRYKSVLESSGGNMVELPYDLKGIIYVEDTVYEVQKIRHRIQPLEIISIYIGRMGELYFYWELKAGIGIYQNVKGFGISQLGKTVFLTQAEAEEALKRMKSGE